MLQCNMAKASGYNSWCQYWGEQSHRPNDVRVGSLADITHPNRDVLPSKADIDWRHSNVRFVLKADVKSADWVA